MKITKDPLQHWISSDYDEKQRLQYLMFPKGIRYSKEKREVQTPRVNSIFSFIAYATKVSEKNEKDCLHANSLDSHFVALPGIEPGSGASETHILSIVLQGPCLNAANVIDADYSCFNCAKIRSVSFFLHNSVPEFIVAAVPAATP